jgi:hypothetical protein
VHWKTRDAVSCTTTGVTNVSHISTTLSYIDSH